MNISLIDDLAAERNDINSILKEYAAANRIPLSISEFNSAKEFLTDYLPLQYTSIFLDIYMDGMSGIEAAQKIREVDKDALIVFLTSSEDHMPEAFRVHAYDYIVKPVKKEKLFPLMDDILRKTTPVEVPRFCFTSAQNEIAISYDELVMVGTELHNYLEIIDRDGNSYSTRMTFQMARDILMQDKRFLLVRRGVIVNMAYIHKFDPDVLHLTCGNTIPISQRNYKKLEQIWDNYLIDKMRDETLRGGRA